ncbi:SGNH/GDSL hydrolase family protein [Algibacter sp. PT7-4]|uniref:SGNH/GDSL hydrolase family protein n=1 Tax=Algibacter ulvanivorans TaxID=3400999 RepID=UPI003AAB5821
MFYNFFRHLFIPLLLISTTFCTQAQNNKTTYNILFIGNSLTYTNNLPLLIKTKAKYSGYSLQTETLALPNHSIADHWKKGEAQKLIKTKKFDLVIIQQGPSSQPNGRKMLLDYGKKYKQICSNNNAALAYFMVWPSLEYYHTFDGVIKNHEIAAQTNDAILLPIGKLWKQYFESSKKFDYYGSDNFHPSLKGSKAAANAITKLIIDYFNKK